MSNIKPQILNTYAIPDFELVHVDVKLASIFGLNEAIVLDRISKICEVSDVFHDGRQWAAISASQPSYYYLDFMTPNSLRRALTSLKIKKIIFSAQLNKDPMVRTNSYRINNYKLSELLSSWDGCNSEYKGNARHVSSSLKQKILDRDNRKCKSCGDENDLSIDHILPVSRGGVSKEHNLQILCLSCNGRKGTKTMDEWLGGGSEQ